MYGKKMGENYTQKKAFSYYLIEKKIEKSLNFRTKNRNRKCQKNKSNIDALSKKLKIFWYLSIIYIIDELNFIYNRRIARGYGFRYHQLKMANKTYNESNLITLNDKCTWLIIHDSTRLKGKCADKILLHKFSKYILGKDYCNKILKIYNNANKINLSELPDKFVLKTNHGSGFNIIVNNKSSLDIETARKKLNHWMNIDFGANGEFHYSYINEKFSLKNL